MFDIVQWRKDHIKERKEYDKKRYLGNKDKHKEYYQQYYIENKEKLLQQMKQYHKENKEELLVQMKQYRGTHKEEQRQRDKQHYLDNKKEILIQHKIYMQTNEGKEAHKKHNSRRKGLGFIPLNKYFEGSDAHHISQSFVIYIPTELHNSLYHNIWTWRNMDKINQLAMGYL